MKLVVFFVALAIIAACSSKDCPAVPLHCACGVDAVCNNGTWVCNCPDAGDANRSGADRSMRCRTARAETAEAAAALDGLVVVNVVTLEHAAEVRELLSRIYAMLTKLGKLGT